MEIDSNQRSHRGYNLDEIPINIETRRKNSKNIDLPLSQDMFNSN